MALFHSKRNHWPHDTAVKAIIETVERIKHSMDLGRDFSRKDGCMGRSVCDRFTLLSRFLKTLTCSCEPEHNNTTSFDECSFSLVGVMFSISRAAHDIRRQTIHEITRTVTKSRIAMVVADAKRQGTSTTVLSITPRLRSTFYEREVLTGIIRLVLC